MRYSPDRFPTDDVGPLLRELDHSISCLQFTNPIQLSGMPERTIITGAILALTIIGARIDELQPVRLDAAE